jgi:predicted Holliday junction resolvase-like endonuclease
MVYSLERIRFIKGETKMKKIEGQMSFNIEPENEKLGKKEGEKSQENLNKERKEKKKVEDRIKVESVEMIKNELTGELCYRIVLFWEVIQQSLTFIYYPKDSQVVCVSRPDFYITQKWWNKFVQRVRAVGSDHYKRHEK